MGGESQTLVVKTPSSEKPPHSWRKLRPTEDTSTTGACGPKGAVKLPSHQRRAQNDEPGSVVKS